MPWGGSKGPTLGAWRQLTAEGADLGWYYTMFLNPLPDGMVEELRSKDLVIVPELNFMGQFSAHLRSLGINAESITQITGLPFKVRNLVQTISDKAGIEQKESVTA
jgi:2-oxoglutarate ferredoxin oxidoreductase subunit alpha